MKRPSGESCTVCGHDTGDACTGYCLRGVDELHVCGCTEGRARDKRKRDRAIASSHRREVPLRIMTPAQHAELMQAAWPEGWL
jgi:hypothetical protein